MGIRASAKALVIHENKLLLNRCVSRMGLYYALPGGGQHESERLEETVQREVLEETGLTVEPMRLAAFFETLTENRSGFVNAHKHYFVFVCRYLSEVPQVRPVERDAYQTGFEWFTVEEAEQLSLFPRTIRDNLRSMLESESCVYLGSERRSAK